MENSIGNEKTTRLSSNAGKKASFNPGDTLGQYKIIRLLGRGGMGEVYEVEHETLEKRFALKLLPSEFTKRPDAMQRFRQEAKVMGKPDHPNIVKVDDFGENDGRWWLRMELANGGTTEGQPVRTLEDYVAAQGGKLSPDEAEHIVKR